MKFPKPFRKALRSESDIASLRTAFEAAAKAPDAADRLMRFHAVEQTSEGLLRRIRDKTGNRVPMPGVLAGVGLTVAGAVTANPLLAIAGFAPIISVMLVSESFAADARDEITDARPQQRHGEG